MLYHIICCSSWSWLRLLPSGWWNCHFRVVAGRCYSQLADGIAMVNYCSFSSEMLNRTSSQICGRWYLPMFLLRDGSLTLIYRASLMVLVRFWSSLPTMSKFSMIILWPVVITQPFIVWHHIVRILFLVASHAALVLLLVFVGWCFHFYLYPVESPSRVFAFGQDFLQVMLLLLSLGSLHTQTCTCNGTAIIPSVPNIV